MVPRTKRILSIPSRRGTACPSFSRRRRPSRRKLSHNPKKGFQGLYVSIVTQYGADRVVQRWKGRHPTRRYVTSRGNHSHFVSVFMNNKSSLLYKDRTGEWWCINQHFYINIYVFTVDDNYTYTFLPLYPIHPSIIPLGRPSIRRNQCPVRPASTGVKSQPKGHSRRIFEKSTSP